MRIYNGPCPELVLKLKNGNVLKAQLKSSKDSADYFRAIFDAEVLQIREEFYVVYMNRANITVGWFRVGVGGMCSVVVDIRLVMKQGLECGATSMVVAHNHPSGNLKPSQEDIRLTNELKAAGQLMQIILVDHIILTADGYYSFIDEGVM